MAVTIEPDEYCEVRAHTEALAAPLGPEDQVVQSMPDASPTKWHRAHTTWFFETFVLEPHVEGYRGPLEGSRYLFNSYYEAVGPRHARPRRGMITRPTVQEVTAYRHHVDQAVTELLAGPHPAEVDELVELGLHHEQQHQELAVMDAKHLLWHNPLHPAYDPGAAPPPASGPGTTAWCEHPGGLVEVGHDGRGFAFDNEGPRHRVHLEPFAVADRLVTCGEWQAFIDDGGYQRPELWMSDGWARVQAEGWDAPLYWWQDDDRWQVFTLAGDRPVVDDEPVVHVSWYEADAYARWAGARLPTEAEWEVLAGAAPTSPPRLGSAPLRLHPEPAGPAGDGLRQVSGDVWQWTSDQYRPYPGFVPLPGAVGEYNGKFMVDQFVLRGGCCATPAGHARATYRNFYPASSRWPFTGVRLARLGGDHG